MAEYQIDVRIYGTVYIKAESAGEALKKAQALKHDAIYLGSDQGLGDGVELSSAMTIHGPDEGDEPFLID